MIKAQRSYLVTMGALFAICLCIGYVGARNIQQWALYEDAGVRGVDWANHIEARITASETMSYSDDDYVNGKLPDPAAFQGLLSDIISAGHIYQIDFVNLYCLCEVSLGSYQSGSSGPHVSDHGDHGHHVGHVVRLPDSRFSHVLNSESSHKVQPPQTTSTQFPINHPLVQAVAKQGRPRIVLADGDGILNANNYAAIYYPVIRDDRPVYLLRLLVDLDDQAALYDKFMQTALALSALILLVLTGYPTLQFIHVAKDRQASAKQAAFAARHDVLTHLRNRNDFQVEVERILKRCAAMQSAAYIFLFDLNNFKQINDTHGHRAGDEVLKAFADLLKELTGESGYVARLGGDEFVVIIPDIQDRTLHPNEYLGIPRVFRAPIQDGARHLHVTISGGVVAYPEDGTDADTLMQAADLALYAAKPKTRGALQVYHPQMTADVQHRLNLHRNLKDGIKLSHITPYYQPLVNLSSGEIEGFEALFRLVGPDGTVRSPGYFGDTLMDQELCGDLGQYMFQRISDDMATWQANGIPFHKIALNVGDGDLKRSDLADSILTGLATKNLRPELLTIEVTENCIFQKDSDHYVHQLNQLRDAGCAIALDDFGTGYSSITQLKTLPITSIKIDRSFVENLPHSHADKSIVTALQSIAHSMSFDMVLEGIETQEQKLFLQRLGFQTGQGYYFARPIPGEQVPEYLHRATENLQRAEAG